MGDLELRTIEVPEAGHDGTQMFAAINRALADIPRARLAGIVALTDGQVHDQPESAAPRPAARPACPPAARRRTAASASSRRPRSAWSAAASPSEVAVDDLGASRGHGRAWWSGATASRQT